jgi:hypothetical protein
MTGLEVQLASLVVHLIERTSVGGHTFDNAAIDGLLMQPDVAKILEPSALLPVTRSGKSAVELWKAQRR